MNKCNFLNIYLNSDEITNLFYKWKIFKDFTEKLFKIKIFMNINHKKIEIKSTYKLVSLSWFMIKKYIKAVITGFSITEASLLLLYDNLYIKNINLKNKLKHKKKLWYVISLLIGKNGIIKKNIEINAKVKLIIKKFQIYVMGTFKNIKKVESVILMKIR